MGSPSPSLLKATALHEESRCESSSQGKATADVPDWISRPNKLMRPAARPQRQMFKPGSYGWMGPTPATDLIIIISDSFRVLYQPPQMCNTPDQAGSLAPSSFEDSADDVDGVEGLSCIPPSKACRWSGCDRGAWVATYGLPLTPMLSLLDWCLTAQ